LVLTLTVLGTAAHPVTRAGARPGDVLYVTGRLGGPLRALRALEQGQTPDATDFARFAHPEARIAVGLWLGVHGAQALIDVSDGLAADLGHVAAASSVRCVLDAERVPRVAGASTLDALESGEEYELACAALGDLDVEACQRETGVRLTRVGVVESAGPDAPPGVELRGASGARVDPPGGHDHFTRPC
jgi:thiamine-monophosphate kinase